MIKTIAAKLEWLGHDSFRITSGGKTIYFDPFRLNEQAPPADIILVSHEHYDHCSPEDIAVIQTNNTVIITESRSAAKLSGNVITVAPGDRHTLDTITVEVVASYNTNKDFHPQNNRWLGFIVTIDGVRIYHAGDTDYIPEMKTYQADIALLPVSGTYVMTAEEAARAALDIKPDIAIPMHFDAVVGTRDDAIRFATLLEGKINVILPVKQAR